MATKANRWTSTPPSEEGWYFVMDAAQPPPLRSPEVANVYRSDGELRVAWHGDWMNPKDASILWWPDAIPEPYGGSLEAAPSPTLKPLLDECDRVYGRPMTVQIARSAHECIITIGPDQNYALHRVTHTSMTVVLEAAYAALKAMPSHQGKP